MLRNKPDCIYDDSDEDCYKCVKHGYIMDCRCCNDYENMFTKKKDQNKEES